MELKENLQQRLDTWKQDLGNIATDLQQNSRRVWLAGLGALSAVDESRRRTFDELVEKGQARRVRLERSVDSALDKVKDLRADAEQKLGTRMGATLERFGVPTGAQIRQLIDQVEQLNAKVERLAN